MTFCDNYSEDDFRAAGISDFVPLEDDYQDAGSLPFIQGLSWDGAASCENCGGELQELGRMDNAVVLQCDGCDCQWKALEGGSHPERYGRR